jgi:anti-sigma B factor antagonist
MTAERPAVTWPNKGDGRKMNNEIVPGFDEEKTENLVITLQKAASEDGCLVMYLQGPLDIYNATGFQKKVERAIGAGFPRLIINLSAVGYVGSSGIAALVYLLRILKSRNGDVVLVKPHARVFEVFQLLGFSSFFTFVDSTDEAVAFFARRREQGPSGPYPKTFGCEICGRKLRAARAGRFRCPECKTIIALDAAGAVHLG